VLVIRLAGAAGDVAARARACAGDVRSVLGDWAVVVSSSDDAATAIERGTTQLAVAIADAMFGAR
jgi:hypothetical protein